MARKFFGLHLVLSIALTTSKLLKNATSNLNRPLDFIFKRVNVEFEIIVLKRILECILIKTQILKRIFTVAHLIDWLFKKVIECRFRHGLC